MSPEPEKRSDEEIRADLALYERSHGLDEEAGDRLTQDIAPLLAALAASRAALTNARAVASDRLADRDKIAADLMAERDAARESAKWWEDAAHGEAKARAELAVEVSQLRAKVEAAESAARPWLGVGDPCSDYQMGGRRAAMRITAALAEPLGSTEDPA